MFKNIIFIVVITSSVSWTMGVKMVKIVPKKELGCIKGLGVKRINALLDYRKTHQLKSLEELLNVKGIGKGILRNIKNDVKKKVCTQFNELKNNKENNSSKPIKKKNISAK